MDAGTGFGAAALELASQYGISIYGVDYDKSKLSVARTISEALKATGFYHPNSQLWFQSGDLYDLPFPDNMFDFTLIRFVYQHLSSPLEISSELFRITKPGGYVVAIDIDDQFIVSYPQPDHSFNKLQKAFARLQERRGGDRYIGRKLPAYLHQAGFEVTSAVLHPVSSFGQVGQSTQATEYELGKLAHAKQELLDREIMTQVEFESNLEQYASLDKTVWQFNANAQVIATARKPHTN